MTDFDFFDDQFECSICGSSQVVPPVGNLKSPVLIVGKYPGTEEIKEGIPMVGPMGNILKQELFVLGMDLKQTRRMNLWQHPPNNNPDCYQHGVDTVLMESKGRKAILLLGDDVVSQFLPGKSVMSIAGLVMESPFFTAPVVASPNPAIVFQKSGKVGEVRFSLHQFVKLVSEVLDEG